MQITAFKRWGWGGNDSCNTFDKLEKGVALFEAMLSS